MLNTSDRIALRLLAFIADNPDASWKAIQMGFAMSEGASYEQIRGVYARYSTP